jgi:transcription-repair coupling factor (superfamily II helicase)
LIDLARIRQGSGPLTLSGAPEGEDARLLAALAAQTPVLHVARDDLRLARLADAVGFFAPGIEVLTLPAWDCLPYDRVSPKADIGAARMRALSRLLQPAPAGGRLLLTTVNAVMQRVPPMAAVGGASLEVAVGDTIDLDATTAFLVRNGFSRSGQVMEPGEFALRGGIVDVFPPGVEAPHRLDLFGDQVEKIRVFDPLTQRTIGEARRLSLIPVSEFGLDEETITRFRQGYRAAFGTGHGDPLYEAVSEGRKHIGMEHWLPLFHERLQTVFDYLPDALVSRDHQAEEAVAARLEQIHEHYRARAEGPQGGVDAPPYKPLPPERLYLTEADWQRAQADRRVVGFSPFQAPEGPASLDAGGRQGRNFAAERAQAEVNVFDALASLPSARIADGKRCLITAGSAGAADRLGLLLADHGIDRVERFETWAEVAKAPPATVALVVLNLEHGFEDAELTVVSESDLLGDRLTRDARRRRRAENFLTEASALNPGDLVVHVEHGIGRYVDLTTIEVGGAPHDCVQLTYDGGDKLYLPVENIEMLSRYGDADSTVALDRLGGGAWQARRSRLKQRIRDMAAELIKIAAQRAVKEAPRVAPPEGLYDEFCARFPFEETEDQKRAIDDVFDDLALGRPMDRLICGDVGFGKTEVAMRSAFAAVMAGGQVAVVTPTTLLCRQHHQTFQERFRGLPVTVRQLSRMVPAKDAAETRKGLAEGGVDIVIGTHALLGKTIAFKRLTLLIVDEEQHFGVKHKERLKQLRADVHVMTLSATPIPRTLQLAMSGVKDLSLIATPPVDRLAVRTFVMPFDPVVVREAILREHYRGGQTFYVCPRIEDLDEVADVLRRTVPEVKVAIAHGQMPPTELDRVMTVFYEGGVDVLLSTTIIESGLDIASANTLIVHRADRFGLAQLYQLRGRVGRSKLRAYAYLTWPARKPLSDTAEKRLKVLQTLDTLGAGFSLASHDLDIRGAGNLLGEEQSGHIKEVGLELYQQMLEEAVAEARGQADAAGEHDWSPQITIGTAVLIPEDYVADLNVRMSLYRRIAALENRDEIDGFAAELIDRFGPLPAEVDHLLRIVAIKQACRAANIEKVEAGPKGATLGFRGDRFESPMALVTFINEQAGTAKLRPDHKLVFIRSWENPAERLAGVERLTRRLADLAQSAAAPSAA